MSSQSVQKSANIFEMYERLKLISLKEIESIDFSNFPLSDQIKAFSETSEYFRSLGDIINPVLKGTLITGSNAKENAIVGCYYRAYAWMVTVAGLREEIHFQGVAAAARSLFEIWVDMELLSDNLIDKGVEKYHAFPNVERFRAAENIDRFANKHPEINIGCIPQREMVNALGKKEEVGKLVTSLWGINDKKLPNYPRHWSGKKLSKRIDSCSQKTKVVYYQRYSWLSWHIHSGAVGYAGLNKDALRLSFTNAHIVAQTTFLYTLEVLATEMKIMKAVEGLRGAIEKIKLAPGLLLLGEKLYQSKNE